MSISITHNAGFFSCSSIALEQIMIYFNIHKCLPEIVDRTAQYEHYKEFPEQDLIPILFKQTDADIQYTQDAKLTNDNTWFQWTDYRLIDFVSVKPFVDKYFQPSDIVLERVAQLERDYEINYENTVGVLYRGNDKQKECSIAPYEAFTEKATDIQVCESIILEYLVSPDETEFLEHFKQKMYSDVIKDDFTCSPSQWLHMPKDSNTAIFMHLPHNERPEHAINVLAMIIMISKCKHVISHTGNMSFWCAAYRGNVDNFHQFREDQWL